MPCSSLRSASRLLIIGILVLDMPLRRLPVALAWTTLSGVTFILLFMWIFVHTRTRRAGGRDHE